MSYFEVKDISFSYEDNKVLNRLSLSLEKGENVSILGPSGCGKSTLLHIIAGFLSANEGEILLNDINICSLPPEKRDIGIVFQEHCLFPHMTVAKNVGFGVRTSKKNDLIHKYLKLVCLEDKVNSFPSELSGGECQRVAVARSLAAQPKILLLDEAFSSLDEDLSLQLRTELKEIFESEKTTVISVTHNREVAESFSSRIIKLS